MFHTIKRMLLLLQAANIGETLNGAGATQLLLTLLSLHLDPACNLLSMDLEVGFHCNHESAHLGIKPSGQHCGSLSSHRPALCQMPSIDPTIISSPCNQGTTVLRHLKHDILPPMCLLLPKILPKSSSWTKLIQTSGRQELRLSLEPGIQAAAASLIDAIPASDWSRKFPDLAAQVAGLGCSHRGAVEVIRLLGSLGERAILLRSHAIAHLLPNMLLTKVKTPLTPGVSFTLLEASQDFYWSCNWAAFL